MNIQKLISVFLGLVFSFNISGQVLNPVKWQFSQRQISEHEFELVFIAKIEKDWNVYSQFTNDDGPVPTYIEYESLGTAKLKDKSIEEGHRKEGYDPLFDTNVIKFLDDKDFIIRQRVVTSNLPTEISGYLTFMTCDKKRCLPPKDVNFNFKLISSNGTNAINEKLQENKSNLSETESKTGKKNVAKKNAQNQVDPLIKEYLKTPAILNSHTNGKNVSSNSNQGSEIDFSKIAKSKQQNLIVQKTKQKKLASPVSWRFDLEKKSDSEYDLIYTASIDDDWTVYSMFSSDDGPVPTYIEFEEKAGMELIGDPTEFGHRKEGPDPLFDGVNVIKYLGDEDFVIKQKIKVTDPSAAIKGYITYMTCDKSHCKPPTDVEFEFDIKNMYAGIRRATPSNSALGMNLQGNILDQGIPSIQASYQDPLGDCGTQISDANENYWKVFLGGFLGGLVAILLPCIFPMIPITVSFFTKDTKSSGIANGITYGLSIIAIFVSFGLAITATLGPTALNELSTNAIANVLFFLIFVIFAISFFGYFEITLPSSWSTKTDKMADKGGLLGVFFMAATLAIVSFSCTGPIIGTALVQVADSALGPFFIMLGFSTALAIPFGLFAAFPAWLNSLPRSGSWMTSVKVVLGFLELALALKFLSVADMTSGWDFLKYELFMGLWVIIFAAMTAYLFGFFGFAHDAPVKKLSLTRKIFAILSIIWTIYIATGFMVDKNINSYSIPKLISGITPPASYNFFLKQNELDPAILAKYPSYSKCANDINCFKDYYDGIAYANEVNKPVLLDFTGYGCVNCRKTEDYIWKDQNVKSTLNDDYVLVSLYVDDRKKLKDVLVAKSSGSKLRNIGNKWADFQIVNFKQNSQPLYVPLGNDQKVLTAPRGYEEGVENYQQFLDCGLDVFKKNN